MKFFAVNSRSVTVRITFVFNEANHAAIAPDQGYAKK